MHQQEHIVAIVEPTADGEAPLVAARQVVERGGRATVVVLLTGETTKDIRAFSESEDLGFLEAKEIFSERLGKLYSTQVGSSAATTVVTTRAGSRRLVFDAAVRSNATTIAVPQRLARRLGWRSSVTRSQVPVLITLPSAA